jgi:hypothetical protein
MIGCPPPSTSPPPLSPIAKFWRHPCAYPLSIYFLLDAHNSSTSLQYNIFTLKMCNFILAYPLDGHRKKAHESSLRLLRFPFSIFPSHSQSTYSVHKKGSRNNHLTISLATSALGWLMHIWWGCKELQQISREGEASSAFSPTLHGTSFRNCNMVTFICLLIFH